MAVLVDEYDKPILDALVEAPVVARGNRDYLRGLYGVIKDCDAHVRFTFLTGISKFSKVNRPRHFRGSLLGGRTGWATGEAEGAAGGALFSQLNNLTDLTLHSRRLVDAIGGSTAYYRWPDEPLRIRIRRVRGSRLSSSCRAQHLPVRWIRCR